MLATFAAMAWLSLIGSAGAQTPGPAGVAPDAAAVAPSETAEAETAPAEPSPSPLAQAQRQSRARAVVGEWKSQGGPARITLRLEDDGRFEMDDQSGRYRLAAETLTLLPDGGGRFDYTYAIGEKGLTLSGGDLAGPVTLTRPMQAEQLTGWLTGWTGREALRKLYRIAVIVLVVFALWLVIKLVRGVSLAIILLDRGPFGWIYQYHKNRALTLNSLVLNIVKYVVYFVGFGFVLSELGVDYTTYLASLSVIGLAIGFGSQGLVQDTVTGFFIILEGQFDVGDMVEISGQVGKVEELGLRMTRLRDYLGKMVVIPNRNIAVVGNYSRGAQQVHVDVAVEPGQAEPVAKICQRVANDVAGQFAGVVLTPPAVVPTGQAPYVRLELGIWPAQSWLIDQQLLPRIREALAAEQLAPPGDRIAVFYFASEPRARRRLPSPFALFRRRKQP